jgi:hypothetical protein
MQRVLGRHWSELWVVWRSRDGPKGDWVQYGVRVHISSVLDLVKAQLDLTMRLIYCGVMCHTVLRISFNSSPSAEIHKIV